MMVGFSKFSLNANPRPSVDATLAKTNGSEPTHIELKYVVNFGVPGYFAPLHEDKMRMCIREAPLYTNYLKGFRIRGPYWMPVRTELVRE